MAPSDPLSHDDLLAQRRFVGALARQLVADAGAAEDVEQETFVRLLDAPPPRPRSLPAWLRTVVGNVARQLHRGEQRRATREEQVAAASRALAPPTDELAARLELQRKLIERVLALPPIYQQVVLLHFYDERTLAETAAALALPLETARTRLRRALIELRVGWNGTLGGERAGLLALLPLAQLAPVAGAIAAGGAAAAASGASLSLSGALLAMSNSSKVAIAAMVVVLASGGAWWASGRAARTRDRNVAAATPRPADVATNAVNSPGRVAPERVSEPAPSANDVAAPTPSASRFGSVRVRVTWAKEKTPIAGLPVRLRPESESPPCVDDVRGNTDEQGTFFSEHVPVGSVIANAAGFMTWTGDPRHPEFFERECTRRIAVKPGATTEVELSVHREVEVDGVVLDPEGAPVAGASIWISDEPGWPAFGQVFGTSDRSGRFHLPVVEGIQHICAFAPGYAPSPAIAVRRNEGRHVELELQLVDEGGRVFGRVLDQQGEPVAHALVYVSGAWRNAQRLPDGTIGESPPARTAATGADGTFDLEGVAVGDVHLVVRDRDHAPHWERFTLTPTSPREFAITLRAGGELTGTVSDEAGRPLSGAEVEGLVVEVQPLRPSLPEPRSPLLSASAPIDEAGRFTIAHLADATFEASLDAGERGTTKLEFTLADGESREWSAVLSNGLSIGGVLVDERGVPCVGWRVEARTEQWEQGIEPPPEVISDADGRFAMKRCRDRTYTLHLFEPSDDPQQPAMFSALVLKGITPDRPGQAERKIEVPASARSSVLVVGRMVDSDGQPIASASLHLYKADGLTNCGYGAGGAKDFRLGPFPPGDYTIRARSEGLPDLDLGQRTLLAGETLDLGTLTLARPGFVEIHARRSDGMPLHAEDVSVWNDEDSDEAELTLVGDRFRSGPLSPGHYQLCGGNETASLWIPFEVVAGKTLELVATVEAGFIRSFRLLPPSGKPLPTTVQVTLTDPAGMTLWSHPWKRAGDGDFVIAQRFARGRHRLTFAGADGTHGEVEFDVVDSIDEKLPSDVSMQ